MEKKRIINSEEKIDGGGEREKAREKKFSSKY